MITTVDDATASRPLRALAAVLLLYGIGRAIVVGLPGPELAPMAERTATRAARLTPLPALPPHPFSPDVERQQARQPVERYALISRLALAVDTQAVLSDTDSGHPLLRPLITPMQDFQLPEVERAALPTTDRSSVQPAALPLPLFPPVRLDQPRRHFTGSLYGVTRGAGTPGTAPLLGGTQAGVRVYRALHRGVAATASVAASPGASGTREATLGLALRKGSVGLIAERSVTIQGRGVAGFRLIGFAGIARALPASFRLQGYGQAGVTPIGPFADGAIAIERPVFDRAGLAVSAGIGSWGAAQRGAQRLDIGPQLVARMPLVGQQVRLSAEWRIRVAGNANPGSGPSITVGADF